MNRSLKMSQWIMFVAMLLMLSSPALAQTGAKMEWTASHAPSLGHVTASAPANFRSPVSPPVSGLSAIDTCVFFTGGRLCFSPEAKGIPGQTLTLYGVNAMTPNTTLSMVWTSGTDQTTTAFKVPCVADNTGSFSCDFNVPALNNGQHPVKVRDSTGAERSLPTFLIRAGIFLSQTTAPPGSLITINGGGYLHVTFVDLLFDDGPFSPAVGVIPDDHGSFTKEVNIPGGAHNGDHTITAHDRSQFVADQTVTIKVDDGSSITLAPASGFSGTTAYVSGAGFYSDTTAVTPVTITFNGATVATCNASFGSFTNCPYTVPNLPSGDYTVHAQAAVVRSGDNVTLNSDATFTIFPTPEIKASPNPITPTSNLTIIGKNFQNGATLGITLNGNAVAPGPDGKSCKADATGQVTSNSGTGPCYILIDRMTKPGNYTLSVSDGRAQGQMTVTVSSAITLSLTSGPVGTLGTISGIGFGGDQQLPITGSITIAQNNAVDFPLGTCQTDGTNSFSCNFTVPAAPLGKQTVTATEASNSNSASAAFTMTPSIFLTNTSGSVGATNTLNGAGFVANKSVTATYSGANLTFTSACNTDSRGSFSCGFTVPAGVAGVKTVEAKDALSNSASTTFTLNTTLSLAHSSGPVGSANTLIGSGFSANKNVTATFDGAALTLTKACSTDASGSFSCDFTVPTAAGGSRTVQATDEANLSASASFTVLVVDLTITKTHTGNFTRGGTGQTYTITVKNSGTYQSSGIVTVTDTLPDGLTATAISGTGWSCDLGLLACQRSTTTLPPGASYQPIKVTVNVALYAPATLTNTATVSGGGDADSTNNTANDLTSVDCATALTVTSNAESGAGSLSQAIGFVCAGGTITFDLSQFTSPITLTSQLGISKNLTIQGPGANLLTISGNHTTRVFNIRKGVTVNISGLTIAQGSVTNANGGGILNDGTLTLTGCAIDHNKVTGSGQGGGLNNTGTLTINGSTFSNNSAPLGSGGGINNVGTLTMTNSTVSGNLATSGGGWLQNNAASTSTLINCTLTNNQAISNGGLWNNAGTCTLTNTIVAGNFLADDLSASDITGTVATSSSFNLIGTGGGGGLLDHTNHNFVNVANPGLALLGNYGGPTQTHALTSTSPALNNGTKTGAPATDQRGVARPVGNLPDMGAFESNITVSSARVPMLPPGRVGTAYLQDFSLVGGTPPFTFSLTGTVPTGLTIIDPSFPELSGTPMQVGSFPICVVATGKDGMAGAACDTLVVSPGPVHHFTVASLSNEVTAGRAFNVILTALDVGNNQVPDFFGKVNLSTNAGTISPSTSGFFTSGELTQSVTLMQAGTGKTISVDDGSNHKGTSNSFTVNPAAPTSSCSLTLSPAAASVPASGGTGNLLVQATRGDCQWRAASQTNWITLTAGFSGTGTGTISYSVEANPLPSARTGTITVEDQSFTLAQAGSCSFSLGPLTTQAFTALGGRSKITLSATSGCHWTATADASFISLSAGGGSGSGSIDFIVAPNPDPFARRGTITIGGQSYTVRQGAQFSDVPPSHPLFEFISKLSALGISVGCGSGNYCLDSAVTREQMAIFITRALGEFNPPQPTTRRFLDVGPERGSYPFIEEFAKRGITAGCGGGNFCPDQEVARGPMAAFLVRAKGIFNPDANVPQRFNDVPPTNAFYGFIEQMWVLGITKGCGGGNYCPEASSTVNFIRVCVKRSKC